MILVIPKDTLDFNLGEQVENILLGHCDHLFNTEGDIEPGDFTFHIHKDNIIEFQFDDAVTEIQARLLLGLLFNSIPEMGHTARLNFINVQKGNVFKIKPIVSRYV